MSCDNVVTPRPLRGSHGKRCRHSLSGWRGYSAAQQVELRAGARGSGQVYGLLPNRLATTICGPNTPPRSSRVIAGSAYRANARSADRL